MTRNEIDVNNLVREDYVVPESVFDKKRTKTSHFLMNTVFANSTITTTEYFVNAFLDDVGFKHQIGRALFVLFKVKPKDNRWATLVNRLRAKSEYLMEYLVGMQNGHNLIMMVYQIPTRFTKDYLLFKEGKYSKFSNDYKKLFPRYTNNEIGQPVESTVWRVIQKDNKLRNELIRYFGSDVVFEPEDELWGIPEDKFEIYRYNG